MSKRNDQTAVSTAQSDSFVYVPPPQAFDAARILVKAELGHAGAPPAVVSPAVLHAVLRGLRRANRHGRIVVLEGSYGPTPIEVLYEKYGLGPMLDKDMRAGDAETILMVEYPNLLEKPAHFQALIAPGYVGEYDCCISVSAFQQVMHDDQPVVSAALHNLVGLLPREEYALPEHPHRRGRFEQHPLETSLIDLYFTIGHYFDGAVVDISQANIGQVVWGDDLLDVDVAACRLAGVAVPSYLDAVIARRDAYLDAQESG